MAGAANRKQTQKIKHDKVKKLVERKYEICRGDDLCCGEAKCLNEFSPSALKCICKSCTKKIREQNRQNKIDENEDYYIFEKVRNTVHRVSIFSSILKCPEKFFYDWIKSQSKDPFNEHFDHVLPIFYFKDFTNASKFTALRDSWINLRPYDATKNLGKHTDVDFQLFREQLKKARYFIDNYEFESEEDKNDVIEDYEFKKSLLAMLDSHNNY